MDPLDMKLMNRLQEGLPLNLNPYGLIAEELGITRTEVLTRICSLIEEGYIRRIGGAFDTRKMGYSSLLMGIRVPEDRFHATAEYVNGFSGVTHNYRRSGTLNMWFTLSVKSSDEKEALVRGLRERFSIDEIYEFPKLKSYKLHVFFDMEGVQHG